MKSDKIHFDQTAVRDVTALILAGGKSKRMGTDKARLTIDGETFAQRLASELGTTFPVMLSTATVDDYPDWQGDQVADRYKDVGPLGGIHAGLSQCGTAYVFAVSCDAPGVTAALGRYLCGYLSGDVDVVLPVLRNGRESFAVAIYSRRALPLIEEQLQAGNYRLYALLEKLRVKRVFLADTVFPDSILDNLNTPEDLAAFRQRTAGPAMIAVSGVKNSGKTSLLEKLITALTDRGFRIAVIKHDGHDFVPDVPGTDTHRLAEAGAVGIGIFSAHRSMVIKHTGEDANERILAKQFGGMDIIFLEGFKHSAYPKIEVLRESVSGTPVCDPNTLLALATDCQIALDGVPVVHLDDIKQLCGIVETYVQNRRTNGNCKNLPLVL